MNSDIPIDTTQILAKDRNMQNNELSPYNKFLLGDRITPTSSISARGSRFTNYRIEDDRLSMNLPPQHPNRLRIWAEAEFREGQNYGQNITPLTTRKLAISGHLLQQTQQKLSTQLLSSKESWGEEGLTNPRIFSDEKVETRPRIPSSKDVKPKHKKDKSHSKTNIIHLKKKQAKTSSVESRNSQSKSKRRSKNRQEKGEGHNTNTVRCPSNHIHNDDKYMDKPLRRSKKVSKNKEELETISPVLKRNQMDKE